MIIMLLYLHVNQHIHEFYQQIPDAAHEPGAGDWWQFCYIFRDEEMGKQIQLRN